MNHDDWTRTHLRAMQQSLGFIHTPPREVEDRLARTKTKMKEQGIEALLVIEKVDLFYLSGTTQEGWLLVPLDGRPLLMIKRELERARIESPLDGVVPLKSMRDLPALIRAHSGRLPETLGMELDVLPVKDYFRYQDLLPGMKFVDSSNLLRWTRSIKSPFEVGLMRKAGEIALKVYEEGRRILKDGMTEIEFGGLLDAVAKTHGHEGILRIRSLNYEAYSWHVLSGLTGGMVSQADSPMGGLGLSPAFPVGASRKVMKAHEPILLDFGICYHGYQADQTRMFSIGKMEQKFIDAYKACRDIHDALLEDTRPGADCEALFRKTLQVAEKLGYRDSYLGPPGLQSRFVGHGIGLELNEFPFMAPGHTYPLQKDMTFAVEPKIVFPGEGAVGIENTVLVTENGFDILTPTDQDILEAKK